jgi:hypothetical protein
MGLFNAERAGDFPRDAAGNALVPVYVWVRMPLRATPAGTAAAAALTAGGGGGSGAADESIRVQVRELTFPMRRSPLALRLFNRALGLAAPASLAAAAAIAADGGAAAALAASGASSGAVRDPTLPPVRIVRDFPADVKPSPWRFAEALAPLTRGALAARALADDALLAGD